jgi:ribonuclease HI
VQFILDEGTSVNIYTTTGKATVQGRDSPEKQKAKSLLSGPAQVLMPIIPMSTAAVPDTAVQTPSQEEQKQAPAVDEPMNHSRVVIYCDGACSPNPGIGGWGAVLISPGHRNYCKEFSGSEADSTNNRMELTAALRALQALKRPCDVEVFTDSMYLRNAFEEGWLAKWERNGWRTAERKPVQNSDLWREILAVARTHRVQWKWVRGHADSAGNNRADELAVEARLRLAMQLKAG